MSKGSTPPAPDYTGAAKTQGAANLQSTIASNILNNPTQITPYGTLTYNQTGTQTIPGADNMPAVDIPTYTQQVNLTPEGQQLFDQYQRINTGLGNIAETGLGSVQSALNQPFDWSKVAAAPVNAGTTGQQAIMERLQPQIDQQNQAFESQMRNQGIVPGSEAYANARRALDQQQNDLTSQAALYGIGLDTSARQQGIQEQEFARTEPLNIVNALRSSAPVTMPTFQGPQSNQVAPANYLGATEAQGNAAIQAYNAQQAQQTGLMSGLATMAGYALGGPLGGAAAGYLTGGSGGGMQPAYQFSPPNYSLGSGYGYGLH